MKRHLHYQLETPSKGTLDPFKITHRVAPEADLPGNRLNDAKAEVHLVNKFPDNAIKVVTKDPVPTNRWVHLLVTYNGSSQAGGVNVYVDGRSRALDTTTDKLKGTIRTSAPLLLGGRMNSATLSGAIDEVTLPVTAPFLQKPFTLSNFVQTVSDMLAPITPALDGRAVPGPGQPR